MTEDPLLCFGLILASAMTVCAAVSAWLFLGFLLGVVITMVAAAIAATSFE